MSQASRGAAQLPVRSSDGAGRDRIAMDLHDGIMQDIYAAA
jgi:signal transduction histidine kinase